MHQMKFLFPTPVIYDGNESRYLQRDGARFAQYLSEQGHCAKKIILDEGKGLPQPQSPLLEKASITDWHNPKYWETHKPDLVLLYGGIAQRMLPIAKAIRPNTKILALKLDSSMGVVSPFLDPILMIKKIYHFSRQTKNITYSVTYAILWWLKQLIFSKKYFYKEYFPLFDLITVENEYAAENTRNYFYKIGLKKEAENIIVLPHPVSKAFLQKKSHAKKNQIIAVAADWSNPLKGGSLLIKTLKLTLKQHPEYSAVIVGGGTNILEKQLKKTQKSISNRIKFVGKLPSEEIAPLYQESKIHVITSGSESGPICASEALCCGCSLVFTKNLKHLKSIANCGFATISTNRSATSIAKAISTQIRSWEEELNYSEQMSKKYANCFDIETTTRKLTNCLNM